MEIKPTTRMRDVVKNARLEATQHREAMRAENPVATATAETAALGTITEGKAAPIVLKGTSIVDEEHGVIVAIGSLADAIDLDEDAIPANLMVKAAHDFTGRDKRTFKANHGEEMKATLAESWTGVPVLDKAVAGVTRTDATGMHRLIAGQHIPDDRSVVATAFKTAPTDATAWFLGIKPSDPAVVQAAKEGKIAGLSFGGHCKREAAV